MQVSPCHTLSRDSSHDNELPSWKGYAQWKTSNYNRFTGLICFFFYFFIITKLRSFRKKSYGYAGPVLGLAFDLFV